MTRSTAAARRTRHRDRGQATVELALCLPVICLLLLLVVQVGLVVRDQLLLAHAAREAARVAAVDEGAGGPRAAAVAAGGLDPSRLTVRLEGRGGPGSRVRAVATYRSVTDVPLVGALVGDVELRAEVTMRVEG